MMGKDKSYKLLYRGTRDGFLNKDFHSNCDGKGETISLVKTSTGRVCGGYTNIPWQGGATGVDKKD